MDDAAFVKMRDQMRETNKDVPLDNEMIVFEGCDVDDKVVLGGKMPFLQHFCTFFTFNVCHAQGEQKFVQRNIHRFNDTEKLDKDLEKFMSSFDEKRD